MVVRVMGGGTPAALLALLLLSSWSLVAVMGYRETEVEEEGERREERWPFGEKREGGEGMFILGKSKQVVKTDGGEVRLVQGFRWKGDPTPMHIGFITMEPNTLFIPQYLDSSLILFVRRGEVKVGWIYKDEMVVKQLKMGDINHIPAGSAFYMVNTGEGQRLQIICSFDASESLGWNEYQSFYIGGGINPPSVLFGFDTGVLLTAFNITSKELEKITSGRGKGPIMYVKGKAAEQPHGLMQLAQKSLWNVRGQEKESSWTWRKLLDSFFTKDSLMAKDELNRWTKGKGPVKAPDSYNLYDRDPDFRNDHGWTVALDERDYEPLKHNNIGIYLVNLSAGAMLAPHVNPMATEYGVVLSGAGTVQMVYPNGTMAMNAEVAAGDVFMIPRYFPFCHIASLSGPMVFFGFTTSARWNRPQFLIGASSVLRSMLGPELAAAFGLSQDELRKLVNSQKESTILPPWPLPKKKGGKPVMENGMAVE